MSLLQTVASNTSELIGRESRLIRRLRPVYETLLNWIERGSGIPRVINGVTYRIDPHQRHRLAEDYDAAIADFLRERIKPGAVCFDVGANVGIYVLQFAHWSGPTGQVVAFEPNPSACTILQKHVEMNGLTERVKVVASAVGEASGEAILYAAEADGMSRLGAPNKALTGSVETKVTVVTLDEYCRSTGVQPDWLLIDIEGFEIAALEGAREVIRRGRGELGIIVEMHPDVWDSANTTLDKTEALLTALGLCCVPLTGQTDPMNEYGIVHLAYV